MAKSKTKETTPPLEEQPTTPEDIFSKKVFEKVSTMKVIPITVEGLSPWSYSRFKALTKCPFQFFLKTVAKVRIPEEAAEQDDPTSANVGKAAHRVLELAMSGMKQDSAYELARVEFCEPTPLEEGSKKPDLTHEQWEEFVVPLNYNISRFVERIEAFGRTQKIKKIHTELKVAISRDKKPVHFNSGDAWLRGVIDLVIELDNSDILPLDHKTGAIGSIKPYEPQLDWYKVMFHFGVQRVKGAQAGVHFIKEGELKTGDYTLAVDIENKILNTIDMSLEGALESVKETGRFKHVRGYYCKWCEYDNLGCKSGKLKPAEMATERFLK